MWVQSIHRLWSTNTDVDNVASFRRAWVCFGWKLYTSVDSSWHQPRQLELRYEGSTVYDYELAAGLSNTKSRQFRALRCCCCNLLASIVLFVLQACRFVVRLPSTNKVCFVESPSLCKQVFGAGDSGLSYHRYFHFLVASPISPLEMPKSKVVPMKNSANVIFSPYLYLGPRTSVSATFIATNGITHVLSIGSTPASKNLPVHYHRLSLSDDRSSSIDRVSEMADAIIEAAKDGKILVHCSAGVSRSPTIAAAYLMKMCDMTLKDALGLIIRARPAACPNDGFFRQLKEMEIRLRGRSSLEIDFLPSRKDQRLALFLAA